MSDHGAAIEAALKEQLEPLAEKVAAQFVLKTAERERPAGMLKTAGEAVGLIAGVVALGYVLGGIVIALRLLSPATRPSRRSR
ncbi:hypothetical protein [Solirubrobacter soli]|uniref:hypothetical protein n=1 Tax=Solirubrobacter soli TaxID=363832 RepID=UPI00040F33A8|nr:hypothetical protein [Solirubrobacter soli]